MIPMSECKPGYLYVIRARNARIGIYNSSEEGSFTISRYKFQANYLFEEYHWDTGAPFGTAKPIRELCEAPAFQDDKEKLTWLNRMVEEYEGEILDCFCPPEEQKRLREGLCPKCKKHPCSLEFECFAFHHYHYQEGD